MAEMARDCMFLLLIYTFDNPQKEQVTRCNLQFKSSRSPLKEGIFPVGVERDQRNHKTTPQLRVISLPSYPSYLLSASHYLSISAVHLETEESHC